MFSQIGPTEVILILLILAVQVAVVAAVVYLALRVFRGRSTSGSDPSDHEA